MVTEMDLSYVIKGLQLLSIRLFQLCRAEQMHNVLATSGDVLSIGQASPVDLAQFILFFPNLHRPLEKHYSRDP